MPASSSETARNTTQNDLKTLRPRKSSSTVRNITAKDVNNLRHHPTRPPHPSQRHRVHASVARLVGLAKADLATSEQHRADFLARMQHDVALQQGLAHADLEDGYWHGPRPRSERGARRTGQSTLRVITGEKQLEHAQYSQVDTESGTSNLQTSSKALVVVDLHSSGLALPRSRVSGREVLGRTAAGRRGRSRTRCGRRGGSRRSPLGSREAL